MPEVVRLNVIQPREHISYSEMGLFEDFCQWRWHLDYAENRRSKVDGIDLSFGTAIHETLELFKHKDISLRPTLVKAISIFVRSLVKEHMRIKKTSKKPYKLRDFIEAGKIILAGIDSVDIMKEGTVIWNEFPLLEEIERLDGKKIKFKGFIDIAIKMPGRGGKSLLYICDFKTCSWGWGKEQRSSERKHQQLFLYKHFVCKKFGLDPKNVRTTFILLKKKPQDKTKPIELFTVSAGPTSVTRAIENLQKTISKMDSGVYVKNRQNCISRWGDRCPYLDNDLCGPESVITAQQEPSSDITKQTQEAVNPL